MAEEKHTVTMDAAELVALLKQIPQDETNHPPRVAGESKDLHRIDIRDVFDALLKHWFWILLIPILCGVAMWAYLKITYVPNYSANAKLYINNEIVTVEDSKNEISQGDLNTAKSLVETCKNIVKMRRIVEPARAILKEQHDLEYTYDELSAKISGSSLNDTEIFCINVTDRNPERAVIIANIVSEQFQKEIGEIIIGSSARIVDPAEQAKVLQTRASMKIILSVLAGFFVPCAFFIVLECLFNDKVEKSEWLTKTFPYHPVLSTIPDIHSRNARDSKGYYGRYGNYSKKVAPEQLEEKIINTEKTNIAGKMSFEISEATNVLRTNILLSLKKSEEGRVIGVTSAAAHEGKSFTSINLAYSLAKNGYKTLLISGDMRLPKCEKYLDQPLTPGLSNVLVGNADPDEAVREMSLRNFSFLPAGDIPPNPSELMWSSEMKKLLQHYAGQYRYVIIDLPPVIPVIDPISISPLLDGMIVIVRHGISRKQNIRRAMSQLSFSGVRVLGFVYNGFRRGNGSYSRADRKYYRSGYGRDYRSSYAKSSSKGK